MQLVEKTLEALKQSELSQEQIARETGLSYHWICAFAQGKIKNPTVQRLATLHEFLTGEVLS